jgi:hypothetical protein
VIAMEKSMAWKWTGATIVAVTLALVAACARPPAYPIQDKIERDASIDQGRGRMVSVTRPARTLLP